MTSNYSPMKEKILIKDKNKAKNVLSKKTKTCIIIDEHPVYRIGIQSLLEAEPDIKVLADVGTVEEILDVDSLTNPDLAILNVSIEGKNSLESLKVLKDHYPGIYILVISIYDEKFLAKRIIRAGAHGYLMKDAMENEVIRAVHDILAGKIYFSDFLRNFMLESFFEFNLDMEEQRIENLNDKEFEVFILMGKGVSMNQIASKLHRTLSTIETYKRNIKRILNFAKTARLTEFAVSWVKSHRIYQ